jgi:O-antigen ligase
MILSLKELIYVSIIAALIFRLAKPLALLFSTPDDFSRRRIVWYALTATAFLSPNFWLFALVAIPVMAIAGRKDSNPGALYLMLLQVIPPIEVPVPMIGMPYLFEIDNYLLLSFCVMTPAALRIIRSKDKPRIQGFESMDFCLLAYGFLTAILYVRTQTPDGGLYPTSVTESLRRGFVFIFSIYIPYFSISRASSSRRVLADSMATFCLNCAILAAIAVFESARGWLLYGEIPDRWGYGFSFTSYVARGSSLRAMASTGHSMALGYLLVVAFGLWLYLQTRVDSKRSRIGVTALFWGGLLAAYTRGAWIGSVFVYFVFSALRPRALSRVFKAACVAVIIAVLIYLSPLGNRIVSVLPFLGGTVDNFNVVYRQRLFERSWQIIQESPMFGDQGAMLKMQDLRQGQGIIDLVNTYVGILLDNGFVGLTLFLSFILLALFKAWAFSRKSMRVDADFGLLGASLVSCIMAMLLLFENGSFGGGPEKIFYVLAALAAAYTHLGRSWQRDPHLRLLDPPPATMSRLT